MYEYRLVFPPEPGSGAQSSGTAVITSDRLLNTGDEVVHHGRHWKVSQAPLEEPEEGSVQDILVWPAG